MYVYDVKKKKILLNMESMNSMYVWKVYLVKIFRFFRIYIIKSILWYMLKEFGNV